MADPIELDGRTLEGGGQLVRMALCLAALTSKPIKITHIRGNRSGGGGLKAQHLACVNWLAHACNARVEGAEKGSKTLLFVPGDIHGDLSPAFKKVQESNYECSVHIGTAGSTTLVLQAILPFILFSTRPSNLPVRLYLGGGTNVSGSPSYDYIVHVLLPTLARIGLPAMTPTLDKRGWSQGGDSSTGIWTLEIPPLSSPLPLRQFKLLSTTTPSPIPNIHALLLAPTPCHAHLLSLLPTTLTHHFPTHTVTTSLLDSHHPKRLYLLLTLTLPATNSNSTTNSKTNPNPSVLLARDWLHERKKTPSPERATTEMLERTSAQLAEDFYSGACVDGYMRDQLVIFQALAQGKCEVYPGRERTESTDEDEEEEEDEDGEGEGEGMANGELREPSLHARTVEWVARRMLGVRFASDGVCEGAGFGGGGSN